MFTDIEGFTALMQADEERALATRAKYVDVLTEQHDAFGGTIVQYFGDGSLSIFPNSVDAVSCAVAAQQAFRMPLEVPVRVGVHVGNVIVEPTGVIGDAVNIASRIESFGFPGAVMISDSVQDQVKNQPAFELVDLGIIQAQERRAPFLHFRRRRRRTRCTCAHGSSRQGRPAGESAIQPPRSRFDVGRTRRGPRRTHRSRGDTSSRDDHRTRRYWQDQHRHRGVQAS